MVKSWLSDRFSMNQEPPASHNHTWLGWNASKDGAGYLVETSLVNDFNNGGCPLLRLHYLLYSGLDAYRWLTAGRKGLSMVCQLFMPFVKMSQWFVHFNGGIAMTQKAVITGCLYVDKWLVNGLCQCPVSNRNLMRFQCRWLENYQPCSNGLPIIKCQ